MAKGKFSLPTESRTFTFVTADYTDNPYGKNGAHCCTGGFCRNGSSITNFLKNYFFILLFGIYTGQIRRQIFALDGLNDAE